MCGINGVFAYADAAPPVGIDEIRRVRDHMAARGPDAKGEWVSANGKLGLGHRRLSIIDLDTRADQPMQLADASLIVVFNGEIYNYRELRRELEHKGCQFRTQSDTEVLLHLYQQVGADMVHRLRGMFAFAIWDQRNSELFLARDPYGIKPLYYADDGRSFRFASQVKALIAGGALNTEPSAAGWSGFFLFGSVPEPYTTYRAVRSLPAGTTLRVTAAGRLQIQQYHSIAAAYCNAETQSFGKRASGSEVQELVRQALKDSVRHHVVSDVPIGAFLSGGIDSGALVGLMMDAGQSNLQTVTLAFSEFQGLQTDEAVVAAEVAMQYGTHHSTRLVSESEFLSELPKFVAAMDQPTIDGLNSWFASKAAHEHGLKVVVSGLGGDELFGSYPSFQRLPRLVQWARRLQMLGLGGSRFQNAAQKLGYERLGLSPKAAGLATYGGTFAGAYFLSRGLFMPWEIADILGADIALEGLRDFDPVEYIQSYLVPEPSQSFQKVSALESSLYLRNQLLRDADWASMAHSLELRTPLVDAWLLRDLAPLSIGCSASPNKQLLRESPNRKLPESVNKPKTGFLVPMQTWLEHLEKPAPSLAGSKTAPGQHWSRRWALIVHRLFNENEAKV